MLVRRRLLAPTEEEETAASQKRAGDDGALNRHWQVLPAHEMVRSIDHPMAVFVVAAAAV
jgi:hypothetical protein